MKNPRRESLPVAGRIGFFLAIFLCVSSMSAVTASGATPLFFDDFNGTMLDPTRWNVLDGGGSIMVASFRKPNRAFWWVIGGTVFFLGAAISIPVLIQLFSFAQISLEELTVCVIGGIASVLWFELFKVIQARRNHPSVPEGAMTG